MDRSRQLFNACEHGDVETVQATLDQGISVDATDDDDNTALQYAAANGQDHVVRQLIMRGAALDKPNKYGWTPLMQACRYGHVGVVASLLQHQADVAAANRYGATALTVAARGGHVQTVKLLLEAGVEVEGAPNTACEFSPLMAAALHGHDAVLRLLLDRSNVNAHTPATGLTPLMLAALNGHMTTAQILIERGGDPNLTNVDGKTALEIAMIRGKREVRGYLERKTTNKPKISPEDIKPDIINAARQGDLRRVREIIDADPSQVDASSPGDGATPLMFAAMTGRLDIAELLVERGCDINKQDTISGWTALMQATYHGKKTVAMFLLNCGADVAVQAKNGCTAFDMASLIDDVDTELLRELAARAMTVARVEKPGRKTWGKQNGTVSTDMSGQVEEQPKSGLRAWWNRMSNRFRNLKLGRTLTSSNRLAPLPLETSVSVQDLSTVGTASSTQLGVPPVRAESTPLMASPQTARSVTSYESVLMETTKSASVYTLDINPPRTRRSLETLKPVVPPFLPAPSFALDDQDSSCLPAWSPSVKSDRTPMPSPRGSARSTKFLPSHLAGDMGQASPLFTRSPLIPRGRPHGFPTHHAPLRVFTPRKAASAVPLAFRSASTTTSPNSSTSGSSSVTPQRSSHGGHSTSSRGSTTSTLTPSPSPTPGKTAQDDLQPPELQSKGTGLDDELSGILKKLSLEKYQPIFEEQEVDMEAFLTLTEEDLKELGIAHGDSRRQILTTITELNTGKGRERQQFVDTMTSFNSTLKAKISGEVTEHSHLVVWPAQEEGESPLPISKSRSS